MAYNNGFSGGYAPYYQQVYPQYQQLQFQQQVQQPSMMAQQPSSSPGGGMIWVQGISGAKSYLLGPNETAILWDSEEQVIYLKSADSSGMPTLKILDYTIRENQQSNPNITAHSAAEFATKNDLDDVRAELEKINNRLNAIPTNNTPGNVSKKDGRKEYNKNE